MCTERYVYPFTDFGFKLLFGTPANKEFLIVFLNSLLKDEEDIVDISYNNTEIFGKSPDDRKAVYDLYCETSKGSHIIVEMQNAYQRYFLDRTIYYSSFPIQAVAKRGKWDYNLPPIYTISFLNFRMTEYIDNPAFKHVVRLMDVETHQIFYNKLTYIYLEMPKFDKKIEDLHSLEDNWLYIIKNLAKLEAKPKEFRDKVFERFFRVAEIARFSSEQRMAYEASLKNMRDYNNTIISAEELGFEKGCAEGANTKAIDIARNLLKLGMPIHEIASATGLKESEISQLEQ